MFVFSVSIFLLCLNGVEMLGLRFTLWFSKKIPLRVSRLNMTTLSIVYVAVVTVLLLVVVIAVVIAFVIVIVDVA